MSVFPGETQVLPGIIVEICRDKTEKTKQNKTINKTNEQKNKNKKKQDKTKSK